MSAYSPYVCRRFVALVAFAALAAAAPWERTFAESVAFKQTALVSDGTDKSAVTTDPLLINPWGLAQGATGAFWISNQNSGTSTLYDAAGTPLPPGNQLIVNIPAAKQDPKGPTGIIFNASNDFQVTKNGNSAPAAFVFVGLDGQITGWAPTVDPTNALLGKNDSDRASFTGLANATNGSTNTLFAANHQAGTVDKYGPDFSRITTGGAFTDPDVPSGLVPFNVAALGGKIYVTYTVPEEEEAEEEGSGAISVFDTDGHLIKHLIEGGHLASPWGLALAPDGFGDLGGKLLVGNFNEEGHINAFDPDTGAFIRTLLGPNGKPLSNDELWSLQFGNGQLGSDTKTLYITAGINDENGGLFAKIEATTAQAIPLPNMLLVSPFVFGMAAAARRRLMRQK
jgi:uncharacterized protein (TIGR03118 family)